MYYTFSEVSCWVFEHFCVLVVGKYFFINNVFNNYFVHIELIFVIESDNNLNFQKHGCRLQRWIHAIVEINALKSLHSYKRPEKAINISSNKVFRIIIGDFSFSSFSYLLLTMIKPALFGRQF